MRFIPIAFFGAVFAATLGAIPAIAPATGPAQAAFLASDFAAPAGPSDQSGRFLQGTEIAHGPGIGCDRNPPPSQC